MARPFRRELALIVAWLVFPLVPVVLEDAYYQISVLNPQANARFGPDPHEWDWSSWVLMLGPLLGYGFLAGATVDLADDLGTQGRWWRRLAARRSVWVAIGPWWGSLVLVAGFFALTYISSFFPSAQSPVQVPVQPTPSSGGWLESVSAWVSVALLWILAAILTLTWSYSWLWPAWAALKRAGHLGRVHRAFYRGLSVALAFVGSLFGSFWVATSLWRGYFFDARVVPLVLVVVTGLLVTSGCSNTITYGEVRRRELFHAMLVAWVLGLALMWRWWSRRRPGPFEKK